MRTSSQSKRSRGQAGNGGFTLIETSMATVIIGVGVLAMVDAQSAFIVSNQWSSHAASATFLANEIRELTRNLPKHDPVNGLLLIDDGGGNMIVSGWGDEEGEVTVDDFDDIDDFDGVTFSYVGTPGLDDNDLPGPINSFGEVIPALSHQGVEMGSTDSQSIFSGDAMFGWFQTVSVEKIDPFDTSIVHPDDYFEAPNGSFPGRDVDEYPLRVSVSVFYQGANDIQADLVTTVTWIVP
ncbi:MAG: prepilin-type N-terminal cleavage/methylation domain-containing protein [Phycisphaerales bacterium]|nr:prepilin-type N-terminal cleavage/methylation domain-containing protein [Phycisphaerales bacterium]